MSDDDPWLDGGDPKPPKPYLDDLGVGLPPTAAAPSTRATKLAVYFEPFQLFDGVASPEQQATQEIAVVERAGLVVIDPDDPATVDLIARALWDGTSKHLPMHSAHKVMNALSGEPTHRLVCPVCGHSTAVVRRYDNGTKLVECSNPGCDSNLPPSLTGGTE